VYAEIGREIEAAGLDSVNRRAVVSGRRKLVLLARASTAVVVAPSGAGASPPALPALPFWLKRRNRTTCRDAPSTTAPCV
jgi:phytoene synthase